MQKDQSQESATEGGSQGPDAACLADGLPQESFYFKRTFASASQVPLPTSLWLILLQSLGLFCAPALVCFVSCKGTPSGWAHVPFLRWRGFCCQVFLCYWEERPPFHPCIEEKADLDGGDCISFPALLPRLHTRCLDALPNTSVL